MLTSVLRLPEVMARTGYKSSSIYAMQNAGLFPKSIKLGPRRSGWLASEVDAWLEQRISISRSEAADGK